MNHQTSCPAYHTKGRELVDKPCQCGARDNGAPDDQLSIEELLAIFASSIDEIE